MSALGFCVRSRVNSPQRELRHPRTRSSFTGQVFFEFHGAVSSASTPDGGVVPPGLEATWSRSKSLWAPVIVASLATLAP